MIYFFGESHTKVFAVQTADNLTTDTINKLTWLFGNKTMLQQATIDAYFVGPRAAIITPWSTNAVEITQNMGIEWILRIEEFIASNEIFADFDPMLLQKYIILNQEIFDVHIQPEAVLEIENIAEYNQQEGLSLSDDEVEYLENLSAKLYKESGRKLTDSEVFGFSQVNSEHCRHKIFNGSFVIDGKEKPSSLFKLIKKTSEIRLQFRYILKGRNT